MGYPDPTRPDAPARAFDLDLGDCGDRGAIALSERDAASREHIARALARGGARLPGAFLRHRLHHRGMARVGQILQAERHRILARRMRELIDELLRAKMNVRTDWIAQMRGAKR